MHISLMGVVIVLFSYVSFKLSGMSNFSLTNNMLKTSVTEYQLYIGSIL